MGADSNEKPDSEERVDLVKLQQLIQEEALRKIREEKPSAPFEIGSLEGNQAETTNLGREATETLNKGNTPVENPEKKQS